MAVSKRLRYEILRRDAHTCRYCGAKAPDVPLTVDHVVPVALGGRDDPENLVTACSPCNAGKSSSSPDAPIVAGVSDDALRWARAMQTAADMQALKVESRSEYVDDFAMAWGRWTYPNGSMVTMPPEWRSYIGRLHDRGLEFSVLSALVDDVLPRQVSDHKMWQYFCGAVRNVMEERVGSAERLIAGGFDG